MPQKYAHKYVEYAINYANMPTIMGHASHEGEQSLFRGQKKAILWAYSGIFAHIWHKTHNMPICRIYEYASFGKVHI